MKDEEIRKRGILTRWVLYPLLKLLRAMKRSVERLIREMEKISPSEMIEEELQTLIDEGMQEGVMDKEDEELLHSVIEFGDTLVREVMVPRMDMVAIDLGTPLAEVLETVIRVGHTRLPVHRDGIDQIVGVLHSKDLLKVWHSGKENMSLKEVLRPVIFFPDDGRISALLREMKRDRTHLAVAVDRFGGTAGLVTLEDLVEEIIGEVEDEFDRGEEDLFQKQEDGWMVDSRLGIRDLAEKLAIPEELLENAESETVGGLVGELLGRLPRAGEEVPFGGYRFRVAKTDGRRVLKVQVRERQ
jgi:CBS domain containing-hemolysin-like protein